jgi:hypothetical protein
MQQFLWQHYGLAAACVVFLMLSHYLSPYLKGIAGLTPLRVRSFAGGVAVAYVFLHMLPELSESRDTVHQFLHHAVLAIPMKEMVVFMVALMGFELFYFMERYADYASVSGDVQHRRSFSVHLLLYTTYNFLLTYTMLLRVHSGVFYAVVFSVAMGLHFVLTDNHFKRYFPQLFAAKAHGVLLFGLLLGYVLSILMHPMSHTVAALLLAFLSGSILYNAFAQEIPMGRKSRCGFFFAGTFVMAALLLMPLLLS